MDDTVYKIAIAGFLHDIGKFAERAGMDVPTEYLNNNAGLYQPYNKMQNRHTHKHAVYTAAFIEYIEKLLPKEFNRGDWGLNDAFINLAAGHHNPQTPLQWIIAMADRVSSGFDRQQFHHYNEEVDSKDIPLRDYKRTRLLTLFEGLSIDDTWKEGELESYAFRYPLKELSPQNIFPVNQDSSAPIDSNDAAKEYSDLFFGFVDALEKLEHRHTIPLWFEHFDSLFLIYASHIAAATVGKVVPDVSLYDHSKMTAALAAALYSYHLAKGTLDVSPITDYQESKFLMVNGDFYGIQDFIFTGGGSTGKAAAKLLRGRSFAVSLINELAADMLCREIGLPVSSIILNAAGKFTILAPNLETTHLTINKVADTINKWLIRNYYGQSSLGICTIEASCDDFRKGRFLELWDRLQAAIERQKYSKINLETDSGVVADYLDSFNNTLEHPLCPFCGKRPSDQDATVGPEEENSCRICRDHIYMGEHLVKQERIAITKPDANLKGDKLLEPIFGRYQVFFDVGGKLGELSRSGDLLKYWDIGIREDGTVAKTITAKFINGYVPKYTEEDNFDDRLLCGKKSAETKLDPINALKPGIAVPISFLHMAKKALNHTDIPDKFRGIEALAVLKADVDNLGFIFSCGIREERFTISRISALSRQMNNYFTIYIPYLLKSDSRFNSIYTVFTGGDDLLLVGPWNRIIEFAGTLRETFSQFICRNRAITISAGISVHKPGEPVHSISETAEAALKMSKARRPDKQNSIPDKDALTLFGETVSWSDFIELQKIKDTIESWYLEGIINKAMLFRLNELIAMTKREKELASCNQGMQLEDMDCLKWRSRLKYSLARNVGKGRNKEEKATMVNDVLKTMLWLQKFRGAMRIPLWQIVYGHRIDRRG